MRSLPLLLSVLSLALLPALARADEPAASTSSTTSPSPEHWYGWQPLMVDGGSIATSIAGAAFVHGPGVTPIEIMGVGGFVLGSPLIHLGHDQPGKAATSFALRTLIPTGAFFTGMLIGLLAASGSQPDSSGMNWGQAVSGAAGAILGGVSGTLLAATIDDVVVAREPAHAAQPSDVRPPPIDLRPTFEPRVSSVRGGATFGVGGTF